MVSVNRNSSPVTTGIQTNTVKQPEPQTKIDKTQVVNQNSTPTDSSKFGKYPDYQGNEQLQFVDKTTKTTETSESTEARPLSPLLALVVTLVGLSSAQGSYNEESFDAMNKMLDDTIRHYVLSDPNAKHEEANKHLKPKETENNQPI